jgi:hypothetical protein
MEIAIIISLKIELHLSISSKLGKKYFLKENYRKKSIKALKINIPVKLR